MSDPITIEFSTTAHERGEQLRAIANVEMELYTALGSLSKLRTYVAEYPGLSDLVLAQAHETLRDEFEGLSDLVDRRIRSALACLLGLDPGEPGVMDTAVLDHEISLAGYGAASTAPTATGEAATSPVGDTVRDATDTSSPPPAGRAE